MAFIKGFKCRACKSTLGKERNGKVWCFCCGAGRDGVVFMPEEVLDIELDEIKRLCGVERGENYEIYPRLNSPNSSWSHIRAKGVLASCDTIVTEPLIKNLHDIVITTKEDKNE